MYLDIIILAILIISILFGIKNGFIVEFISIFGVLINFVITQRVTPMVLEYVQKYIGTNYTFTYIVLFIVIFVLFSVLIHLLNIILKGKNISFISRIFGGFLSLLKGGVICLVILLIYNVTAENFDSYKKYGNDSVANREFLDFSENLDEYIPSVFKEKLKEIRDNKTVNKYIDKLF